MSAPFIIKAGDLLPPLSAVLTDQKGDAQNIAGYTLKIRWRRRGSTVTVENDASIDNPGAGRVSYEWTDGDTDTPGVYEAEWVGDLDGKPRTWPTNGYFLFEIQRAIPEPEAP